MLAVGIACSACPYQAICKNFKVRYCLLEPGCNWLNAAWTAACCPGMQLLACMPSGLMPALESRGCPHWCRQQPGFHHTALCCLMLQPCCTCMPPAFGASSTEQVLAVTAPLQARCPGTCLCVQLPAGKSCDRQLSCRRSRSALKTHHQHMMAAIVVRDVLLWALWAWH